MDEFRLQRSVARGLLAERPSTRVGMAQAMERVIAAPRGRLWRGAAQPDWEKGQRNWDNWFERLLRAHPIPKSSEVLWFEVPSELNPALTSVSAYDKLGTERESYGLDEGRTWPADAEGITLPAGLHELPELESVFRSVGWERVFGEQDDLLRPGVYALSYAYTVLLVLNGLPKTGVLRRLAASDVAVVTGWVQGDADPVGQLTTRGWERMRRVKQARRAMDPEELDPDSPFFDLRKYIKAGGDLEARDEEYGATVLMRQSVGELPLIRQLLESGADVRARDNEGSGVLHWFGAARLPVLRMLLAAGADPALVNRNGESVLDRVAGDGRCTVRHLELLIEAGAQTRAEVGADGNPIRDLAASGLYERGRGTEIKRLLDFWISQGFDVNAAGTDGLSPLWIALHAHAEELKEHLMYLRIRGGLAGRLDSRHDDVAIMLLERGADPNARCPGKADRYIPAGAAPLMVRRYDDDRLVRALLKHGADPRARCMKGKTALDYARLAARNPDRPGCEGAQAVVEVLRRAMMRKQPVV